MKRRPDKARDDQAPEEDRSMEALADVLDGLSDTDGAVDLPASIGTGPSSNQVMIVGEEE